MNQPNHADELEERLIDFSVRVTKVVAQLPGSSVGRHIADQLTRCGTAPAPHYAEARGAESKADFAHKLGMALKELNECSVWLRMIQRAKLVKEGALDDLIAENKALARIFTSSIRTVRAKLQPGKSKRLSKD